MNIVSTSNRSIPINMRKTTIFSWYHSMIWSLICIIAMVLSDPTSLFSYGYALILLTASSFLICKHEVKDVFFTYHFYLLIAIVIFAIQKLQFPEHEGLTGGLAPLDDASFYAEIVDGRVRYYWIRSVDDKMAYSILLKLIYPFYISTPLNIVTVNILSTAYLPIFVRRLSNLMSENARVGYYAFLYSMLCPFTLFFGCIILRESFTAVMVIAGLCYFIQKKYIPLAVCVVSLIWVRFGTLAFLIVGIILLYRFQLKRKKRTDFYFALLIIGVIAAFYLSFAFLQDFSGGKLSNTLIRSTDSERYEDSTIGSIMMLPFPINIILSTAFFLFIPLFNIPKPIEGYIILNGVFQGFLTPLFMFFLWKYIFNASLISFYRKNHNAVKQILYIVLLFALLLGTISMQSRHKTVLFPILCMLAAYGKVYYDKKFAGISTLIATLIIVPMLFIAFINFIKTVF